MIKLLGVGVVGVLLVVGGVLYRVQSSSVGNQIFSETEVGFEAVGDEMVLNGTPPPRPPDLAPMLGRVQWSLYWQDFTPAEAAYYATWQRAPGPLRVGIQVGHWKNSEVPDELAGLERNGGGAQGGGKSEVDVVYDIALLVQGQLEAKGIVVDLLPATVPSDYEADAFVSIHADGATSPSVNGFKIAGPRRDFSGKTEALVTALYTSYRVATGLREDTNITRRMSGYYAFNWRRYEHAVHPMTPAVIVETGFLTSARDREVLVDQPEKVARGIADGIQVFLAEYNKDI